VLIDRWVASRIVNWPSSNCFACKLPIVAGAKWIDLICDVTEPVFIPIASLRGEPSRKPPLTGRWGTSGASFVADRRGPVETIVLGRRRKAHGATRADRARPQKP
jgi:hypothetical protein